MKEENMIGMISANLLDLFLKRFGKFTKVKATCLRSGFVYCLCTIFQKCFTSFHIFFPNFFECFLLC